MQTKTQSHTDLGTVRDTVESIWIAIVLAFVLRAFFVEAFVIPTGSMAPRLLGEHWDLQCPNCAYDYAYGLPSSASRGEDGSPERGKPFTPSGARCPNCDYSFTSGSPDLRQEFVNAGDRVLVMKYLYDFRPPEPWDVVVFRNPQNNQENYIKRLIALPGETVEIVHGDIFIKNPRWQRPDKSRDTWHIRRKPQKAQDAMWQVIFDNDYRPLKSTTDKQWAEKSAGGKWQLAAYNDRRLMFHGNGAGEIVFKSSAGDFLPTYGYNQREQFSNADIVTDLKLSAEFVPQAGDSAVRLNLSSFDDRFSATVKADGSFAVVHSDQLEGDSWQQWASGSTEALELSKGHVVAIVHVDFQVQLWIDDQRVFVSDDNQYSADYDALKKRIRQARGDSPDRREIPTPQISISGDGGAFDLLHVRLMRDVFYTNSILQAPQNTLAPLQEFANDLGYKSGSAGWATMDHPLELQEDSFFVLGDNSPQSLDGRGWMLASPTLKLWKHPELDHSRMTPEENRADAAYQLGTVPRYNMIGKAFFVYWPCGFRAPGAEFLPIVPNVGKMRLIR